MTKKIIEVDGKFAVKTLDENGSSLGVGSERFDTEAEAQASLETPEPVESAPETVNPADDSGATPGEELAPEEKVENTGLEVEPNDTGGEA